MTTTRRVLVMAVAVISVLALVTAVAVASGTSRLTQAAAAQRWAPATDDQLIAAAGTRVFFAHQSVGRNILDALPDVYGERGVDAPPVVKDTAPRPEQGGYIQHVNVGTNGDPLGKIREFDAIVRGGVGDTVDVAVLKLCYEDVRTDTTDVGTIFDTYAATIAALEQDYPEVTFLYATVPLTTERGPLGRVKALLGRGDRLGPEHNVERERLNEMLRTTFASSGRLFDIARLQSTTPDGARLVGERRGDPYEAMHEAYASDPGHLNAYGAARAAEAFLALVAGATP